MSKTIKGTIFNPQEAALEVEGITLLSVKEAKSLPLNIRKFNDWWWLRTHGYVLNTVALVYYNGSIYYDGTDADTDNGCVRPALRISNLKSLNRKLGDKISIFDLDWTVIGDETVLCDTPIGKMSFRKDWNADDANDFEASDVKKFLDEWLAGNLRNE